MNASTRVLPVGREKVNWKKAWAAEGRDIVLKWNI